MWRHFYKYFLNSIFLFYIVFFTLVNNVYAIIVPTFPSCINPQGEKIVYYSNGVHGVPGDMTTYTGSDAVYRLSETTLMQCLCPADGRGIQTNWWKVTFLTHDEIDSLISKGSKYVPNGLAWGLTDDPYLVKNLTYSCLTTTSNGGTGGGGGAGSSSSSSSGAQSGSVSGLSTYGSILGLASTGNIKTIIFFNISGITLILFGLYLKRNYVKRNI